MLALVHAALPSKVPFYIAGGVLAGYAVLLAAVGIAVPDFPYGKAGQRMVILLTLVIVAATIAMSVHTSAFE